MDPQIVQSPFEWFSTHLHLVGWPAIVYVTYRLTRFLSKAEVRLVEFEKHFEKATTNDLPHIQQSVDSLTLGVHGMKSTLNDMRQDLSYYVYRMVPPREDERRADD